MMRKYLLLCFILSFTSNLEAQNRKIIGKWKENYNIRIDTTVSGIYEIQKDIQAYRYGTKELSSQYTDYYYVYPEKEDEKWEISITEQPDGFWISAGSDWKSKLLYDSETNSYYVTMKKLSMRLKNDDWIFVVAYDLKTQHLLFIEKKTKLAFYDFVRKQ